MVQRTRELQREVSDQVLLHRPTHHRNALRRFDDAVGSKCELDESSTRRATALHDIGDRRACEIEPHVVRERDIVDEVA
ncbi:MAG: hypothetical protein JWO36_747 [Myxococcales bacterium]|nr:hypothetical protein [Myxococcales bacterium]